MCGITGIIGSKHNLPERDSLVLQSITLLKQRGPDASGSCFFPEFAAGHTRLSIIDTSADANQPFSDLSGRYHLVFNGEIFNYRDLKSYLQSQYHVSFHTNSDTEVLLHLLIHEGENALKRLNGFWALAFYDTQEKQCLLARDPLGKKPLCYAQESDFFAFASEFKALNIYPISKELDMQSVAMFFRLSYLPAPHSPFKNVRKMEPGSCLWVDSQGRIKQHFYYKLPYSETASKISYDEAQDKVRTLLRASVERRLIADVPLGGFLSGGLDSALVAALAKEQKSDFQTFCLSFPDLPFLNESHFAEETAKFIGTKHQSIPISQKEMLQSAYEVLDYTDELFADSSAIAVNALCKTISPHLKVALSGDGGDEVFGGYRKHQAMLMALKWKKAEFLFPDSILGSRLFPASRHGKWGDLNRKYNKWIALLKQEPAQFYNFTLEWFHADFVSQLLLNEHDAKETDARIEAYKPNTKVGLNEWLYTDLALLLQGDMLTKVDLFSMRNAMEIRNPLLDVSLVDFASQLPEQFKTSSRYRKRILFDAFASILPPNMAQRPKKGFEVPLQKWMQEDWNKTLLKEWLHPDKIKKQKVLNPHFVDSLCRNLQKNNHPDLAFALWNIIVFTNWYDRYCTH